MQPHRRFPVLACLVAGLVGCACAYAQEASPPVPLQGRAGVAPASRDAAADRQDILRVEAALCHAWETGDAAYLRTALEPTFTLTSSNGTVTDYTQNVAEVEKRDPAYTEFRNHGQDVRLYGDAAIVTGVTTVAGSSGGEKFAADFQFTDTWVRRDGTWRLAASHASRLPAKATSQR